MQMSANWRSWKHKAARIVSENVLSPWMDQGQGEQSHLTWTLLVSCECECELLSCIQYMTVHCTVLTVSAVLCR